MCLIRSLSIAPTKLLSLDGINRIQRQNLLLKRFNNLKIRHLYFCKFAISIVNLDKELYKKIFPSYSLKLSQCQLKYSQIQIIQIQRQITWLNQVQIIDLNQTIFQLLIIQMNKYFALASLILLTISQTPILLSSPQNTIVLSPAGYIVVEQKYHTANNPNMLGTSAKWIWLNGSDSWPDNFTATFQTLYYSTCPSVTATLTISGDNVITSYNNGIVVGSDSSWRSPKSFNMKLKCGVNNLTNVVTNHDKDSPAALIFSVSQNQNKCSYQCGPASSYYDFKTCQCQCISTYACSDKNKEWVGYPVCGCKCTNKVFASCKSSTQYFNEATCGCQCIPTFCASNLEQDPSTCQCKCKAQKCKENEVWSYGTCACQKGKNDK